MPCLLCLLVIVSEAQNLPKNKIDSFLKDASVKIREQTEAQKLNTGTINRIQSGAFQNIAAYRNPGRAHNPGLPKYDTLFVGLKPNDSLIITGTFFHDGPVFVYGSGILRFKNATATILGDVWVWGDSALMTADSSTLIFPQQYFYQRSLIIAGKGRVVYRNTTLDHSGLSHNLALTDSARMEMYNVFNNGFTTCGLYRNPQILIRGTNEAGEFVITDNARITVQKARTVLLWHQFPKTAVINSSFPKGDTVHAYTFNKNKPGISGINYTVAVDTCYAVMWGMMPTTGSDVTIVNSRIRAIGLWFEGGDSIAVNGLVNNSSYADFTPSLPDRKLHLVNSQVQTWSLYPMDSTKITVSGSIVGEIGSQHKASVTADKILMDGSGGYWWATDTTFMISGFSTAYNAVRSDRNAIFLFAYSTLSTGEATALGNSIFMAIQSQFPDDPKPLDRSCVWLANIGKPSSAHIDTIVPVYGSAWIDKTAASNLMEFAWYSLSCQAAGDTLWHPICQKIPVEKRDEVLANWDTHGLTAGAYLLRLVLCDNTADSNQLEALKQIQLNPIIVAIDENRPGVSGARITVLHSDLNKEIVFTLPRGIPAAVSMYDISGRQVRAVNSRVTGTGSMKINIRDLSAGVYFYTIKAGARKSTGTFIITN